MSPIEPDVLALLKRAVGLGHDPDRVACALGISLSGAERGELERVAQERSAAWIGAQGSRQKAPTSPR